MATASVLLEGLAFGESPRWHDGALWVCDWGAHELLRVGADGGAEVVARVQSFPFCIDWLPAPDGRLLAVSAADQAVLAIAGDGTLADLLRARWAGGRHRRTTRSSSTRTATCTSTAAALT